MGVPRIPPAYVLESGKPVLGICYGMQLLTHALGGKVSGSNAREFFPATVEIGQSPLFADIPATIDAWMSHGDRIDMLPAGWQSLAKSTNSPFAAMCDESRHYYAGQFHPEV